MSDSGPPVDFNKWPPAILATVACLVVLGMCWIAGEVAKALWA